MSPFYKATHWARLQSCKTVTLSPFVGLHYSTEEGKDDSRKLSLTFPHLLAVWNTIFFPFKNLLALTVLPTVVLL